MYRIIIPRDQFEQTIVTLLRQPQTVAVSRSGRNRTATATALLYRDCTVLPAITPGLADGDSIWLRLARTAAELNDE